MYDSLNGEPVHLFPQYYFQDKPDTPIYSCQGTGKTYVSGDKLPLSSPAYHYPDNFLIFDPSPLDDQLNYVLHIVKDGRLTDSFCHAKNPNYKTPNSHFQPIPDHIQSLLDTNSKRKPASIHTTTVNQRPISRNKFTATFSGNSDKLTLTAVSSACWSKNPVSPDDSDT